MVGGPLGVLLGSSVAAVLLVASAYVAFGPRVTVETALTDVWPATIDTTGSSASPTGQAPSTQVSPAVTSPSPSGAPSPGGQSPGPDTVTRIGLNDTSFTLSQGWVVYADETIEGDRRLVRLRGVSDDARLQVVTLVATDPDLTTSCKALVTSQVGQFTDTTEFLTLAIGVAQDVGEGRTCGFTGVRTSDGVRNSVSFTLVRRAVDGHVLMLRQTTPDVVGIDARSRRDLSRMTCEASAGFGVPLPLC